MAPYRTKNKINITFLKKKILEDPLEILFMEIEFGCSFPGEILS
jgi:hypothetical protein